MSDLINTELWIGKSNSGKGLTVQITERRIIDVLEALKGKDSVYLHIPVSQMKRLLDGEIKGCNFAMADPNGRKTEEI